MLLNSSRQCNCLVVVIIIIIYLFIYLFFKFSIWCYLVHVSSLLTYIHYNSNMGGQHRYCFPGSPSLTCISLKFDLYVYL